jgi:hypothetical protein
MLPAWIPDQVRDDSHQAALSTLQTVVLVSCIMVTLS